MSLYSYIWIIHSNDPHSISQKKMKCLMKSTAFGASLAVAHGNTEARGKTTFSTRDRQKSQAKARGYGLEMSGTMIIWLVVYSGL